MRAAGPQNRLFEVASYDGLKVPVNGYVDARITPSYNESSKEWNSWNLRSKNLTNFDVNEEIEDNYESLLKYTIGNKSSAYQLLKPVVICIPALVLRNVNIALLNSLPLKTRERSSTVHCSVAYCSSFLNDVPSAMCAIEHVRSCIFFAGGFLYSLGICHFPFAQLHSPQTSAVYHWSCHVLTI